MLLEPLSVKAGRGIRSDIAYSIINPRMNPLPSCPVPSLFDILLTRMFITITSAYWNTLNHQDIKPTIYSHRGIIQPNRRSRKGQQVMEIPVPFHAEHCKILLSDGFRTSGISRTWAPICCMPIVCKNVPCVDGSEIAGNVRRDVRNLDDT